MFYSDYNITTLVTSGQIENNRHGYLIAARCVDNGKMHTTPKFPNRIANLSLGLGMKQADLAKKMNKTPQEIGRFWNGVRKLDQIWIERFAAALGYPAWAILDDNIPKDELDIIKAYREMSESKKSQFIHYMEFLQSDKPVERKEAHYHLTKETVQKAIDAHTVKPLTETKSIK